MYRNIVQRTIADCMAVPNLWTLRREHDSIMLRTKTHDDALQYLDYEYKQFKSTVSLLQGADVGNSDYIIIGSTAYCLECSEIIGEHKHLYCDSCSDDGTVWCNHCENDVHEDDAYNINGYWYCTECCSLCDHCEEYRRSEITPAYSFRGYRIHICETCRDDNYYYCEGCDDYYHGDTGHTLDDGYCCNDCYDKEYCTCDGYGEDVLISEIETIDYSNYCDSCAIDVHEEAEADIYMVSA